MIAPGLLPPTDLVDWIDGECEEVWTAETLADVLKLARFGAWAAGEFRSTMHDVEGGEAQDAMERCGVLVKCHVTESCGETCTCAEWGDFPQDCYKFPPGVAAIVKECGK